MRTQLILLERMLAGVAQRQGAVLLCGTCADARAVKDEEIIEGTRRGSLDELTEATVQAGKVVVF